MYPSAPHVYAQQQYARAVHCAQTAWGCECLGNAAGAGRLYHQATPVFAALVQVLGPQAPDPVFYYLGCCQVRLAWLAHVGGHPPAWAQQWLVQALPNLHTAWQRNPGHPAYQLAVGQVALALGRLELARQVCRQPPGPEPLAALGQVVRGLTAPGPTAAAGTRWLAKVQAALAVADQGMVIFQTVAEVLGDAATGGWFSPAAAPACAWAGETDWSAGGSPCAGAAVPV